LEIKLIILIIGVIILTALSIFYARNCIIEGLALFKKNIRMIVLCSVALCFAVILRFQLLWFIDMFYHPWGLENRTHIIPNIFTMFDHYRSIISNCLHRGLIAASYLTQLVLAGMLLYAKFLVITKLLLMVNNRDDSFRHVYETVRANTAQNKKEVLKLCLIEISPFYLSRLIRAFLIAHVFFGSFSILGHLVGSTAFVAYAISLVTTMLSSYMICHTIYKNCNVIEKSPLVAKQTRGKMIALFVAFYGVYGLSDYILSRLSFLIFSITGLWEMLPIRVIWVLFDMFTVASLLLLSAIIFTESSHCQ